MAPNYVYLKELHYLPEKRQIVAEFFGQEKRLSRRYSFFPYLYLPASEKIFSFLLGLPQKKFSFSKAQSGAFEVICSDFESLIWLCGELKENGFGSFEAFDPKRQFLLQKSWSYFGIFSFEGDTVSTASSVGFDEISPLKADYSPPFSTLLSHSEKEASVFLEKLWLSNLLCILPQEVEGVLDKSLFLAKNMLFSAGVPVYESSVASNRRTVSKGPIEFNFAQTLIDSFCFPNANLGIETLNCSCCVPSSFEEKNVSPSSMVLVEFLVNGFYFEPKDIVWSEKFHHSREGQSQRLAFKNEWRLKSMPVGPFFKGQKEVVSLLDALFLPMDRAKIISEEKLFWHCINKESFLSVQLKHLLEYKRVLSQKIAMVESKNIAASGVLFFGALEHSFEFNYFKAGLNCIENLLDDLPSAFSGNPQVFGQEFSTHVLSLRQKLLADFLTFCQNNHQPLARSSNDSVFFECEKPLALAEVFSKSKGVLRPKIVA